MNESMIEVVFKVYGDLPIGEEIRISGNVPGLGCDDPDRSLVMITTPSDFPWWRTKEGIFLPDDPNLKYRYCIFSGGKFDRWEDIGNLKRSLEGYKAKNYIKQTEDKLGKIQFHHPELAPVRYFASEAHAHKAKHYAEWSRNSNIDNQIKSSDEVIIVSYFLPVTLKKVSNAWTVEWDKENLLSFQISVKMHWIGTVRYQNAPIPPEDEEEVARILALMNCHVVFLSQSMHHQFYDIYCKQNLWPIMHHIADVYGPLNLNDISAKAQQNIWYFYSTVHKLFRDKTLEIFQQGNLVWIHGFHLVLLPSFLRRRLPKEKIGYFFHTPFPSSEIWRTMSRREDLLRGILGADQIGFHLYEYARHFSTVCQRLLGCTYDGNTGGKMILDVDGRKVALTCMHVGIDLLHINEILTAKSFTTQMKVWKEKFANKVIVAGIERLERLKGIPLKLSAIDKFMEDNPQWQGKIVFTLIGISASERGLDYKQTLHDVNIVVRDLNKKYAIIDEPNYQLIYFEERADKDIRLRQRLEFFASADVLMITAARDGLNRYPMEYCLARQQFGEDKSMVSSIGKPNEGIVIISEFISSARVMRGSLVVNPWRLDEVKLALHKALEMDAGERSDRMRRNLEYSVRLTTSNWAVQVLHDLKSVEKGTDRDTSLAVGFGMQYKIMDLKAGFQELDVADVCKTYRIARHRLIILDWGGTLVAKSHGDKLHAYAVAQGHAEKETISDELFNTLEALCADHKNIVFVVSGKEQPAVTQYFGSVKYLGLGAEHGFYYKWPRGDDTFFVGKWQSIMEIGDQTWKETAKAVMDLFVQRTHGTYIEQKGNALIWQYSEADPEFGKMQSKELEEHLHLTCQQYPVEIIRGGGVSDGYIEVRPTGASKGLFLEHCLSALKTVGMEVDFVLAIGDDSSDEPMFERIAEKIEDNSIEHTNTSRYSVTVGKKPTSAMAYLDDPNAVLELLNSLSKCSDREKRYFSAIDLPSHGTTTTKELLKPPQSHHQHSPHNNKVTHQYNEQQQQHFIHSSITNPITTHISHQNDHGLIRTSLSAGQLIHAKENVPRKSATHTSQNTLSKTIDNKSSNGDMNRINSSMNLSMMNYMQSLNESNIEDDGAIFF